MKIVIVDDDCLVTEALKTILEVNEDVQVLATGSDGRDAVCLYAEYKPDVLLMDIRMKNMNGLEASAEILKADAKANILLLTTFLDDEYIVKALRLGAKGYLLKQDYASILPALRAVYSGQTVFGQEIVSKIPDLIQRRKILIIVSVKLMKKKRKSSVWLQMDTAIRKLLRKCTWEKEQ